MKGMLLTKKSGVNVLILPLIIMSVLFSFCTDDETVSKPVYDPDQDLVLNDFIPDSGGVGEKLIIMGENFGSDTSLVRVTVNEKNARVIGVSNTRIYAVVPSRADTGLVSVTVGDQEKGNTQSFTFDENFYYQFRKNVSTIAGQTDDEGEGDVVDGKLSEAWFNTPVWLALDRDNSIYVLEEYAGVRKISPYENMVSTPYRIGGAITRPRTIDFSLSEDTMYLTNDQWDANGASIALLQRSHGFMNPKVVMQSQTTNAAHVNPVDGEVFFNRYSDGMIFRYDRKTHQRIQQFRLDENDMELSFSFTRDGKTLYMICRNRHYIFKADYDFATKSLSNPVVFAGRKNQAGNMVGLGQEARFDMPCQGVTDSEGNLYVADKNNHCIRMITPDGNVSTFAGVAGEEGYADGQPNVSKFRAPEGLAIDKNDVLYVADTENHRIRRILVE
jgi:hypothetical protein